MRTHQLVSSLLLASVAASGFAQSEKEAFNSTIPVVDIRDFYHPETKQKFVNEVSQALQTIGFFAMVGVNTDQSKMDAGFKAMETFFAAPMAKKDEIWDPEVNGQRGYVHSEIGQLFAFPDTKEFLHIGPKNGPTEGPKRNRWPDWMDLKTPMHDVMDDMREPALVIQKAIALGMNEDEDFLVNMTDRPDADTLLRPLYYPANPPKGSVWATMHTDTDMLTLIPKATADGLEVLVGDQWIPVRIPTNAYIVNGGDKLRNLSNGFFKSAVHRVMAPENMKTPRYSIVYFIHPSDNEAMDPRPNSIALTGGVVRYPQATSLEILAIRLRELGLASKWLKEFERDSGVMDRIGALVEAGVADEPVKTTYSLRHKHELKD